MSTTEVEARSPIEQQTPETSKPEAKLDSVEGQETSVKGDAASQDATAPAVPSAPAGGGAAGDADSAQAAAADATKAETKAEAAETAETAKTSESPVESAAKTSDTSNSNQDVAQTSIDPSMDNEISKVTGRPRLTAEDNEKLRSGARFFHKAMASRARAMGEDYRPYRIPAEMRAALAKIDHEAAVERAKEKAAAEGHDVNNLNEKDLRIEHSAIEQSHAVSPEEQERLRSEIEEQNKIDSGGARFYGNYQKMVERHSAKGGSQGDMSEKAKFFRNLKLALIVVVALGGYIAYNEFIVTREAQSISELKSMLPFSIDAHTAMVRIDDRNDEFKIYFERSPEAYANVDESQKEADLDAMVNNAPMLCKNALLHSIINSGKKVTLLLDATDGSFHRESTVESCPVE